MPFATPLALLALASLPALAAIYVLRNRYRREVVSSLMLWRDIAAPREGGSRVERMQVPLLMLLELAVLLMLVVAAAGPRVWAAAGRVPLVVVLDDSASMLTGPRKEAEAAVIELLDTGRYSARFILAGRTPQLMGDAVTDSAAARDSFRGRGWTCRAAEANLDQALAVAGDLAGKLSRILVITDHAPPDEIAPGKLQWWSFGKPLPNVGFVSALRSASGGGDRCLVEVANFSDNPARATLTFAPADNPGEPFQRIDLPLAASQAAPFSVASSRPVLARLSDDAMTADNTALLLPDEPRVVSVRTVVTDEHLARALGQALKAVPDIRQDGGSPDLVITDDADASSAGAWTLRLLVEKDAAAYTGPFVVDRAHPLTEGLSLDGVIWGAGKTELPSGGAGRPIITAGNVVLVSEFIDAVGRRDTRCRVTPQMSTLLRSPAWPILIYNAVEARRASLPGLQRANIRVGETAELTLKPSDDPTIVKLPDGTIATLPGSSARLSIPAPLAGVYEVRHGEKAWTFAANMISRSESDLRGAVTGKWGDWKIADEFRWDYRDLAWVFGLLAAGLLCLHLFVVSRSGGAS